MNAERLLGSLVRSAMRGGRSRSRRRSRRRRRSLLSGGMKGAVGLGALGVAMAAFEHFTSGDKAGDRFTGGATRATPPPPLPPTAAGAPPPPPPATTAVPPPPSVASDTGAEAVLLVRAMIAAANADHDLDDEERGRLLAAIEEAGLGEEERRFLSAELESPLPMGELAARVDSPELARQVYLASRMAIEVDTGAEENYLRRLAERLDLGPDQVEELERMLGDEGPPAA